MRRALPFVAAGLLAACSLPPYTTPEQTFSVKYSMFVPNFANGVPIPVGLPGFDDKTAPSSTVPVPKEAKSFKLASLELNLKLNNTGPVPLRIKIFLDRASLSDADLYAKAPLGGNPGGTIDLPRGGTGSRRPSRSTWRCCRRTTCAWATASVPPGPRRA
jgi:hypothetical protein